MTTPIKFNFSLFTPYEGRMLTTEASDLGLTPGNFPEMIVVDVPPVLMPELAGLEKIVYTFTRYNGLTSAMYRSINNVYPTLEVFND